jgi:hypothetical protein
VLLASLCAGSSALAAEPGEAALPGSAVPGSAVPDSAVPDTAAWRANTGLITGLGLAVLIPNEGDPGFGVELYGRYGIPAGPVILAPGALLGGYYLQHRFAGDLLGTFRVTLPLGPLAPFAQGGLGPGVRTNPSEGGLAWLGGGGLMIHLGRVLALGVEVNYQGITGTGFKTLALGPSIIIGG